VIEQAHRVFMQAAYCVGYHWEKGNVKGFVWLCVFAILSGGRICQDLTPAWAADLGVPTPIALHDQFQDKLHRILRDLPEVTSTTDKSDIPTHESVDTGQAGAQREQGDTVTSCSSSCSLRHQCMHVYVQIQIQIQRRKLPSDSDSVQ
jgi:hypothetical protein